MEDLEVTLRRYSAGPSKTALSQADSKLSSLTTDQYKYLRRLCKTDLFFLAYGVLGYDQLSTKLHGHVCSWMIRNRAARFRELLLPRGHFKSTIWTIADSIRIALPDDNNEGIWPECLGPNCRILIAHETAEQASKFLVSIAKHFLTNALLRGLFPEIIPTFGQQRINKFELELRRDEIFGESTFEVMGVGGKSQGKHYNLLKLDDIIGDKARDSKAEMETAIGWIDNIQSFFVEFTRDHLDITGTRWAPKDLYHHIAVQYGPSILRYIRPAEEFDKQTETLKPIFPEKFTTESFAIIKQNPIVWYAQYANNPEVYSREFLPDWLRFYENFPYSAGRKLVVFNGSTREQLEVNEMDKSILIDPAMSGLAGVLVTGGIGSRIFILEAKKHNWKPPELIDYIFQLVNKWQPRVVAIEEVLFSGLFKPWLQREMQVRRIYFYIQPVKTHGKTKEARLRGLANYFAGHCIFFHKTQQDLLDEYESFGSSADVDNVHLLDALAQGPEIWMKPIPKKKWEEMHEAEDAVLALRDAETGY